MIRYYTALSARPFLLVAISLCPTSFTYWNTGFAQEPIAADKLRSSPHVQESPTAGVATILPPLANEPRRNPLPSSYAHLGEDVLNCEECRRRLGLSLLVVSNPIEKADHRSLPHQSFLEPAASTVPGTPSVQTQASSPAVSQPSTGLSDLPLEARQQLLKDLSLPAGATILSAKFIDSPQKPAVESSDKTAPKLETASEPSTLAPLVPRIALPSPSDLSSPELSTPKVTEAQADPSRPTEAASMPPTLQAPQELEELSESDAATRATQTPEAIATESSAPQLPATGKSVLGANNQISGSEVDAQATETIATSPAATELVVDGVLRSPALQQIQIDFLKKQLAERDDLIRQINSMQPKFQQQIDDLSQENDQLRKREQELANVNQHFKVKTQQELQRQELRVAELKAEILELQQNSKEQEISSNERLADAERARFSEVVKFRKELAEVQNDKVSALVKLRKEIDVIADTQSKQASREVAEQKKMLDAQSKTIENLVRQLDIVRESQTAELNRLQKNRQGAVEFEQQDTNPANPGSTETDVARTFELGNSDTKDVAPITTEPTIQLAEPKKQTMPARPLPPSMQSLKSTKPKIPRIETPKPAAAETMKSF